MEVRVVASTQQGHIITPEEVSNLAGKSAGVCYMPHDFATLNAEDPAKTLKRAGSTKRTGHHSVFGHAYVTMELENIPKLFAMLLNNEKVYNTSEKSARYTKMNLSETEQASYTKWLNIFEKLITERYGHEKYFDEKRIRKLAMENARYMTSVMTPTSMVYTTDFRQLNYMCGWMSQFEKSTNPIYRMLAPTANEFLNRMQELGYLDEDLMNDGKNREFSLIGKRVREQQFGECYSVNYNTSLASLAQLQRHRSLHYEMMMRENPSCFVPRILFDHPRLMDEWNSDFQSVAHLLPQGTRVFVNERGDYENLILKAKERLCTAAQLEVMANTKATLDKYIHSTDNEFVRSELRKIAGGARCTSGYKCATPCAFKEGINLSREI